MRVNETWELVVGCEVHCQLATESKIFSAAPTAFGADPNSQVNEVDLGLPGVLPVLNQRVVELALKAGLALKCQLNQTNVFARKNYFYPDLPKGYQISQHDLPIWGPGHLNVDWEQGVAEVGITRIHLEEDAGKLSHVTGQAHSLVDLNRAGVPLIEIVTEPDMRHPDEVVAFLKELRTIVVYLGVCDGNMEEGSFRCDANVSVRKHGESQLGTRCELKNINSFKFVKDAIKYEMNRQIEILEAGGEIIQQTRLFNPDRGVTYAMRDKEESHDYRYFPEPDLPPLTIDPGWLDTLQAEQPELPAEKRERYQQEFELSEYDAGVLSADRRIADFFESALKANADNPKTVANWVINELLSEAQPEDLGDSFVISPEQFGSLTALIDNGVISGKIGKKVFGLMLESGDDPDAIVEREGLKQVSDEGAIAEVIDEILAANPDNVAEYRDGKKALLGWFMGQVMKETRGKADPGKANQILREKLDD